MGWKLRKEKLRADADPEASSEVDAEQQTAPEPMLDTEDASVPETPIEAEAHPETEIAGIADAPIAANTEQQDADEPLVLDTPTGDADTEISPAFEPLSFEGSASVDDSPTFDVSETEDADTPDFGSFLTEPAQDASWEATPAPEAEPPVFAMPPMTEPIAAEMMHDADAPAPEADADPLGAFAPYQPAAEVLPEPDAIELGSGLDDPSTVLEPEVGATAFAPEAPSPEPLETAEPDADAPVFEPSFETADTNATAEPDAESTSFMNREALAAGLVSTESESGLPMVAPFVLNASEADSNEAYEIGPHTLVVRIGNLSASYPISKPVMTIGRPDTDSQNYPDVEIDLDDSVSRKHAEVRHEDNEFLLVDLASTNGTSLNGELLTPNQPVPLMHGDHIRVGERTEIVFE